MKMRILLTLALAGLVSAGDDSMDSQYCCMVHHNIKVQEKVHEYLDADPNNQFLQQIGNMYQSFGCQYVDGWSYCCPSGGEQTVLGNALCACNSNGRPTMQDCDDVDDWMEDVIKAKFGHNQSSDWTPDDDGFSGRCENGDKDECGCCPGFGWDSDDYKCEYGDKTSPSDTRWCKAFSAHPWDSDDGGAIDSADLDLCGCMAGWGWDSIEDACEPYDSTDDDDRNPVTGCLAFLNSDDWANWDPTGPADGPTGGGGVGRRLLEETGRGRNDSDDGKGEPRDACGCIKGKQGWDDGKCKNNRRNDSDEYTTDYEDARFCKALRARTCNDNQKDECGCCPYWGWDDDTCEPGEVTSDRDKDSDELRSCNYGRDSDDRGGRKNRG